MTDVAMMSREQVDTIHRTLNGNRNPVHIGYTIYTLSDINSVAGTFSCDLKIFCKWYSSKLKNDPDMVSLRTKGCVALGDEIRKGSNGRYPGCVVKVLDPITVEESRPRYEFANAISTEVVDDSSLMYLSPSDEPGWVRWEQRYRCVFRISMDLHDFPFDVQNLEIRVRLSQRSDTGRVFTQYSSTGAGPQTEMKSWIKLTEWSRYEPCQSIDQDSKMRSRYIIELPILRKPKHYVFHVMAVNTIITLLSLTAYAIPTEDVGDRLSVILTMMLTAVAFKIVVHDKLPAVDYFTILDTYMNAVFVFMVIVAAEVFVVGALTRSEKYQAVFKENSVNIDLYTCLAFVILYCFFHLWFVVCVRRAMLRSAAKLSGKMRASAAEKAREQLQRDVAEAALAGTPMAAPEVLV